MNYFDKNKILTVSVTLLLIINLGILGLLWIDRKSNDSPEKDSSFEKNQPRSKGPGGNGPKEFLIRELKFDEKQKQNYTVLVEEHKSEMKRLKDKIRKEKEDLWESLSGNNDDPVEAERLASEIGTDQKEIEIITYRHFQKVKELCTEDQKKKFDEVINKVMKMMGPGPQPPPQPN